MHMNLGAYENLQLLCAMHGIQYPVGRRPHIYPLETMVHFHELKGFCGCQWTLGSNTSLGDAQNGLSLLALVAFSLRDSIIMFASNMSISLPGVPCGTSPSYHYILKVVALP